MFADFLSVSARLSLSLIAAKIARSPPLLASLAQRSAGEGSAGGFCLFLLRLLLLVRKQPSKTPTTTRIHRPSKWEDMIETDYGWGVITRENEPTSEVQAWVAMKSEWLVGVPLD